MRLLDLRPCVYRHEMKIAGPEVGRPGPDGTMQWGGFPQSTFIPVSYLSQADRIMFLCPKCFAANGGPKRTHSIAIDFAGRGTPDSACVRNNQGQPVRWNVSGTAAHNLSLTPSILLLAGCCWHGFVTNGEIIGV